MSGPRVTVSPSQRFGRPVMCSISTEVIADAHWSGEDVVVEYGLTRHELPVALWFETTYGQPRFRQRWGGRARQAGPILWNTVDLDPNLVELPPTSG